MKKRVERVQVFILSAKPEFFIQAALHPLECSLRPSGQTMLPCFFPVPNTLVL